MKAPQPFVSGFCSGSNPPDSHARCMLAWEGRPCVCACHEAPTEEPEAMPSLEDITGPVVLYNLDDEDYHGHQGSLSASGAKWLAPPTACPAKFKHYAENRQTKAAFDFGHVAHRLVLGKGAEIEVLPYDSMRTNAAKEAEEAARAEGKTPILAAEYAKAKAVAKAVLEDPLAGPLFEVGKPEVSLFWPDPETGIIRRARLDWLRVEDGKWTLIGDLKTTKSAEPIAFGKSAADYGYAISAANYIDGVMACGLGDDPAFLWVAAEKTEPYVVTTRYADDDVIQLGRYLMREALRTYADCLGADRWPGYSEEVLPLELPYWYTRNFEDIA